ncbi:hypothetical protein RSAG8_07935, partial [Rhizoctonia solani AG-8 WAC10335]
MSQTFTSQIELTALQPLGDTHAVPAEIEQYFPNKNAHTPSISDPSTNPIDNHVSGFRIGNVFIEDKVIILLGSCMGVFVVGVDGTATGANLPSIQEHYHLPYAVVSLVFLAGFY